MRGRGSVCWVLNIPTFHILLETEERQSTNLQLCTCSLLIVDKHYQRCQGNSHDGKIGAIFRSVTFAVKQPAHWLRLAQHTDGGVDSQRNLLLARLVASSYSSEYLRLRFNTPLLTTRHKLNISHPMYSR